ncbi:hypothetical protein EGW08_018784 [Elysia chlorotica]|uniref:Uncharacterized protein n=1 Tax=Elysia chlorotica TaxID=188477 RepID=A0A3S0ZF23_ELYCH|nr:hypothetical protein EGW08_018784 [Elysia chlorotica]
MSWGSNPSRITWIPFRGPAQVPTGGGSQVPEVSAPDEAKKAQVRADDEVNDTDQKGLNLPVCPPAPVKRSPVATNSRSRATLQEEPACARSLFLQDEVDPSETGQACPRAPIKKRPNKSSVRRSLHDDKESDASTAAMTSKEESVCARSQFSSNDQDLEPATEALAPNNKPLKRNVSLPVDQDTTVPACQPRARRSMLTDLNNCRNTELSNAVGNHVVGDRNPIPDNLDTIQRAPRRSRQEATRRFRRSALQMRPRRLRFETDDDVNDTDQKGLSLTIIVLYWITDLFKPGFFL